MCLLKTLNLALTFPNAQVDEYKSEKQSINAITVINDSNLYHALLALLLIVMKGHRFYVVRRKREKDTPTKNMQRLYLDFLSFKHSNSFSSLDLESLREKRG